MINKNKTAFTLLELSIAVTVIAFVVTAIILGGNKLRAQAKVVAAQALTKSSPVKDIPNLELWLESTLKDSFIPSEIYSSTSQISTWYDINKQSAFQNNATQATSGLQPVYTNNAINGLPAVFFNSTDFVGMTIDSALNIVGNYSAFVVFKTGTSLSGRVLQAQSVNWLLGGWTDGVNSCVCNYAEDWVSTSVSETPNKVYLVEAIRNTISKFYINGVDKTNDSSPITAPGNFALGAAAGFNEPTNGYIGEVIIFSRDLSTAERQDVESYLIKKWKIS